MTATGLTWSCGARDCRSHRSPSQRCDNGVWFCGRRSPLCPGHGGAGDRCAAGALWHCGSLGCPLHTGRNDACPDGLWVCGRLDRCLGHARGEPPCDPGGLLVPLYRQTATDLARQIAALLRKPEVRAINFRLGPVTVRGGDYEHVARGIETGRILVVVNARQLAKAKAGARYNHLVNAIVTPFAWLKRAFTEEMYVVHECTHALVDWHRMGITTLDSESAAFVAGMWYAAAWPAETQAYRVKGQEQMKHRLHRCTRRCPWGPRGPKVEIMLFHFAQQVADEFQAGRQPCPSSVEQLHRAIRNDPVYKDKYNVLQVRDGF
jgi:hypothetical protein